MNIEYEAKFANIDKASLRNKLRKLGAILIQPQALHKRVIFNLPKGQVLKGGRVRVRDEGEKITMSVKATFGNKIKDQKEILLTVSDFHQAISFLKALGCEQKAYQESKREVWKLDECEITLDEWPFLEPFIEIEADSEQAIKTIAEKLGFDYSKAVFGAIDILYYQDFRLRAQRTSRNNWLSKNCF